VSNQTEANKRWQEKNKERAKYLSDRSRARSFIRNQATDKDIIEFKQLLKDRESLLDQEGY
jgi:ribosomal protein S20